jgi:hypothetical protein
MNTIHEIVIDVEESHLSRLPSTAAAARRRWDGPKGRNRAGKLIVRRPGRTGFNSSNLRGV